MPDGGRRDAGRQQLGRGWGPCAGSHLSGSLSFTPGREVVAPLSHLAGRAVCRNSRPGEAECPPAGRAGTVPVDSRDAALPTAVCRGQRPASLPLTVSQGNQVRACRAPRVGARCLDVNQILLLGLVGLVEPRTFSACCHPETRREMSPQQAPSSKVLRMPWPRCGWPAASTSILRRC